MTPWHAAQDRSLWHVVQRSRDAMACAPCARMKLPSWAMCDSGKRRSPGRSTWHVSQVRAANWSRCSWQLKQIAMGGRIFSASSVTP